MDLAEIPTQDLMGELARRFDTFFCAGARRPISLEADLHEEVIEHREHGDSLRLLGLIEREKYNLLVEMQDDSREEDDEP